MCLGVFHFGFILFWTLWLSWTWVAISFHILGKFSSIISSSIFSWPFFLSSSGTPMIQMLGCLTLSQRSLMLSSFLLILFSSLLHLFPPFYLLPHLSYFCLRYSTVSPLQSVFDLIYCIILEKAMAPHSSTLAWKIPWTEEPGRLQSMGLLRVGQD